MTSHWLFWMLVASVAFAYPLVTRVTGASSADVGFWCLLASVPVVWVYRYFQSPEPLPARSVMLLVISGVMLGVGMIGYAKLISTPGWPLSIVLPATAVVMAAILVVGGVFFYGETLTLKQVLGLAFTFGGIWLLN